MQIKESKKVIIDQETLIGHKCDICEKEQVSDELPSNWHYCYSIGGFDQTHVCSIGCYVKILTNQLEETKDHHNPEIDGYSREFATNLVKSINKDLSEKGTATKLQKLLSEHRDNLQNLILEYSSKFTNDFVYFELDFAHQDKHKFLNHLLNGKMSFEYLESVLEKLELNNK